MTKTEFINYLTEIYHDNLKMDVCSDIHQMHTDKMKIITAFIGLNPACHMYGKIIGFFSYKHLIYRFHFHIHKPHQKYSWLSNQMTELDRVTEKDCYGETFIEYKETSMGNMAFWEHTSLDYLKKQSNDSYELRKLMNNIRDYSRAHDFCKMLRKTDRIATKINPIFQ